MAKVNVNTEENIVTVLTDGSIKTVKVTESNQNRIVKVQTPGPKGDPGKDGAEFNGTLTGSLNVSGTINLIGGMSASAGITAGSFTGSLSGSVANINGAEYFVPRFTQNNGLTGSVIYQSASFTSIRGEYTPEDPTNPEILYVNGDGIDTYNLISAHGNINDYVQINIQNYNAGSNASSDIVATANNGTENSGYVNMGINSELYSNSNLVGGSNDAYVYSTGADLLIGNASPGYRLVLFNGGIDSEANAKVYIHENGVVGINTNTYNAQNPSSIHVHAIDTQTYNVIQAEGEPDNYLMISVANMAQGSNSSADIVAFNNIDPNGQQAGYIDVGINSTYYVGNLYYPGSTGDAYVFTDSHHLILGSVSQSNASRVTIFAGGINEADNAKLILYGSNQHQMTGSLNVSEFVTATQGFTGSLFGTASWALNALTASYALNAGGGAGFPYSGSAVITGSLIVSSSGITNIGRTVISGSLIVTGSPIQFIDAVSITGSLTTTGSAKLIGDQQITGSLLVTQSHISTVDWIDFTVNPNTPAHSEGRVHWNVDRKTLQVDTDVNNFMIATGHVNVIRGKNTTNGTLTAGTVVYITGNSGQFATFGTASWDDETSSAYTIGIIAQSINQNNSGYAVIQGEITGINTNGYTPGTLLYLSSSGQYGSTKPVAPLHTVRLGQVVVSSVNGSIQVKVDNGYETDELHDVILSNTASGDLFVRSGSVWINSKQLTGSYGLTGSLNISGSITATTLTGTASYAQTASYAPAYLPLTGGTINGNVILNGTASIAFLNVTYESSSIIISTGSNIFGDAADDSQILYGTVSIPTGSLTVSGSTTITGSLFVTNGITGSIFGTSSWAQNAVTASYVPASAVVGLNLNQIVTGSVTASVGIGTASFQVTSGSSNFLFVSNSGNVGIGTSVPFSNGVGGGLELVGTIARYGVMVNRVQGSNRSAWLTHNGSGGGEIYLFNNSNTNTVYLNGAGFSYFTSATGNLGIGTATDSGHRLFVTSSGVSGSLNVDNRFYVSGSTVQVTGSLLTTGSFTLVGNEVITGSSTATAGYTGSLFGTSSWSQNSVTASFITTAQTASFVATASWTTNSLTSSYLNPLTQSLVVSGSVNVIGNITGSRLYLSSSNGTATGSTLIVYGSGSSQPVFSVQGSQGELFSVTDSLSGSLFSVNDISGLPVIEAFSDNRVLIGSYQAPALYTTVKTVSANGNNTIYSIPTASYDGAFFDYTIRSGSNARAGQMMAIWSASSVNYTETVTNDFGDTSTVRMTVQISGSNLILTGSFPAANWTMKTIVRSI
jgi:hypothetical protein